MRARTSLDIPRHTSTGDRGSNRSLNGPLRALQTNLNRVVPGNSQPWSQTRKLTAGLLGEPAGGKRHDSLRPKIGDYQIGGAGPQRDRQRREVRDMAQPDDRARHRDLIGEGEGIAQGERQA